MKTYIPKSDNTAINHKWYIVDANGMILGKLATKVADVLRGKNKAIFVQHIDVGDNVIVINAKQIKVTGKKLTQKLYRYHSGYFGNMKQFSLDEMIAKRPVLVIEEAVSGMLPKNKLRKEFMKKLKVYPGSEHPHGAQKPEELKI